MTTQATEIRDALFDLLSALPGYAKVRKVPQRQLQPEELPCITVVRGEETMHADGDANASVPHFVHEAAFHISVVRGVGDPVVIDGESDDDMDLVQEAILRSGDLIAMFEGILSLRRSMAWPQQGDAYYVELRLEMTVQYRSSWAPFGGADLDAIDVTVGSSPDTQSHTSFDLRGDP